MLKKLMVVAAAPALTAGSLITEASARGFGGVGFHGGGFHGGGFHGGWRGGGFRGAGLGLGLGLGLAGAYGYYGAYGYPAYASYGYGDGCLRLQRVWTPFGPRLRRVNVCY